MAPSVVTSLDAPTETDAHPFPCHHDKSTRVHRIGVSLDQLAHGGHLLCDPHLNESDYARMVQTPHEDQLTEILVFGDEHSPFMVRQREQRFVRGTRIYLPS